VGLLLILSNKLDLNQETHFTIEIIYKKGEEIPADFLSRNTVDAISSDLNSFGQEQNKYKILRHL
jgi:hypothetical protein